MSHNIISMDESTSSQKTGWRVKPMLALPTQHTKSGDTKALDKILSSSDYWAEPKINGHRCVFVDGDLYSRQLGVDGNQVCNSDRLPHILQELNKEDPNNLLILDGELAFDVADCSNEDVATILGADPDKAQERLRVRALVYFVFDILRLPSGEDISGWPLELRRRQLDRIFKLAFTRYIIPVEVYDPQRGYNLESVMDFARNNNWEGLMFKNRHSVYSQGSRKANTWYKWKISTVVDEQVFITAILDPEKYYRDSLGKRDPTRLTRLYAEGLAGKVRIAQINPITGETIDRGKVGAWSDKQRKAFTTEPEKWIGKCFDIAAFRKTEDGKFISPRFVRWRDDLRPEDCSSEPTEEQEQIAMFDTLKTEKISKQKEI